jgi:hypothetical protein
VEITGDTFGCRLETDWNGTHRGVYPRFPVFHGVALPCLKFGPARSWTWLLDLQAHASPTGVVVTAQGYQKLEGQRIPFLRVRRFFFAKPEMLYEVAESKHLEAMEYVIAGVDPKTLTVAPDLSSVEYTRAGVVLRWQFAPRPVSAGIGPGRSEFVLRFEGTEVETLVCWAKAEDADAIPTFTSISTEIEQVRVTGPRGERTLATRQLHECVEPDETWQPAAGEVLCSGVAGQTGSSLTDMAVRRLTPGAVALGAARIFQLERVAESATFPMLKPSLVRAMRSLKDRMVFGAVPEDDPTQPYIWGTGTWPRCFSVQCLDLFGFHEDAYAYLEFMLDASRQFVPFDGLPHLWDNFYITGSRLNERLYDINGHSIKLYEAGKFYLNHRADTLGTRLLTDHYETLKGWCQWIERHLAADGAVLDETESNLWALGYGTFTQAPAAAGVHLFVNLAKDAGRAADVAHFTGVVERLLAPLSGRLFGDAANPYLEIPAGTGRCYLTYLPVGENTRNLWDGPVQRIGLSCYSLAANYFLQDPQVGLLAADDPRARETLDLALQHLSDQFDPRIVTWHNRRTGAHMGYGQGQLLQALIYAGRETEFRERLTALFEVSAREIGDIYLMQEVLGRQGNPNRGNKAHLTYYPVLVALLAGWGGTGQPLQSFITDLVVSWKISPTHRVGLQQFECPESRSGHRRVVAHSLAVGGGDGAGKLGRTTW